MKRSLAALLYRGQSILLSKRVLVCLYLKIQWDHNDFENTIHPIDYIAR